MAKYLYVGREDLYEPPYGQAIQSHFRGFATLRELELWIENKIDPANDPPPPHKFRRIKLDDDDPDAIKFLRLNRK